MGILQQVFCMLDTFLDKPTALNIKVKGKGQLACYSAASMGQVRVQKCFIISEVAADCHDLIIRPSFAPASQQLDPQCSMQMYHYPNQPSQGLHLVTHKLQLVAPNHRG